MSDIDRLTGHRFHCPECGSHLTSLLLCPECGDRYGAKVEVKNGISVEATLGRFSPRVLVSNFLSNCWWRLHVVSSAIGIAIIIVVAGLVWVSDLIFGES